MERPPSIVAFERLYLGSIAVYIVNAVIFWTANREMMNMMGRVRATPGLADLISPIMIVALLATVLVSVLFWYLVVRKRHVAGKWLVVVTEAIGAVLALLALGRLVGGTAPNPASILLGLVSTALAIAAAIVLFRPDARTWLGERSMLDGRA